MYFRMYLICSVYQSDTFLNFPKILFIQFQKYFKNLVINLKIQTLKYCIFCSGITITSRILSQDRKITANFLKGMSKDRKRTADFIKRIRKLHQEYCKFH